MEEERILHLPDAGGEVSMLSRDRWAQVHALNKSGWSIRKIAKQMDVDRNTVRNALRNLEYMPYQRVSKQETSLSQWAEFIHRRVLEVDFNATKIYNELKSKGYSGSYSTVKQFIKPLRDSQVRLEKAYERFETSPAKQAQVDWGTSQVMIAGQPTRIQVFVMVLGYSRAIFAWFTTNQKFESLIEGHMRAFEWFGGISQEILYDNMKTVVDGRNCGKVTLNKAFVDFADFQGFTPRLCEPYRPQTKGKVESGVKYIKNSFLKGESFQSIEHLNNCVENWIRNVADERIHGTTHRRPKEAFAVEQPLLGPFKPFQLPKIQEQRIVGSDALVTYKASRYSVPWHYVSRDVTLDETDSGYLNIYHGSNLIATHMLSPTRHQVITEKDHYKGLRKRPPLTVTQPLDVEIRPLSAYECFENGGVN